MSKKPNIYAGLSKSNCADTCNADGCVISGANVCAHPNKGALQSKHMTDRDALKRLNEARDYIAKQK